MQHSLLIVLRGLSCDDRMRTRVLHDNDFRLCQLFTHTEHRAVGKAYDLDIAPPFHSR